MPAFRYKDDEMPDYLRGAAKRNLATEDARVGAFNNRVKYLSSPVGSATNGAKPAGSSFKFSGIGGTVDTSIGAPVDSFTQPSATTVATNGVANNNGDWRFRSFGPSQLNGNSPNMDKAYGQQVSPVVTPSNPTGVGTAVASNPNSYRTHPDAYDQSVSRPVIPSNYKPKDISDDDRKRYGWGPNGEEEGD